MTRTNSRTRKATTSTASMSSNPATSGGMGTPATMAFGPLPISPPPDVDSSGAGMARAAAGCTGGLHAIHELITQTLGSKPPMPPAANGRSASDLTQVQERRPERFFFRPGTDTSPFSPSNAEMAMSCKAFVALPDGVTAGWCPPPVRGREFGATMRAAGARELLVVAGPAGVASRRCIAPRSRPTRLSHRGRTGRCGGAEENPLRGQYLGGRDPGGDARVTRQRGGRAAARRREESVGVNLI